MKNTNNTIMKNFKNIKIEIIKKEGSTMGVREIIKATFWSFKLTWISTENGSEVIYNSLTYCNNQPRRKDAIVKINEVCEMLYSKKDFYFIK